jgi:hypothetical protein
MLTLAAATWAQSTFGVVLGTVKDASGAVVKGAKVKLTNTGENVARDASTNDEGVYEFQNVKAGTYGVEITQQGFATFSVADLTLLSRQTLRVDATLDVRTISQSVEVAAVAGVIATDSPAIASSLSKESVLNLPSNVRGAGSTTPYALLQTLPGVQADNGLGLSIQGGIPAQSESSVDGISITQVTGNSPQSNQFLSVESISEMKVQGVGNTAEFGQPGDITLTSKSGTNVYHGAAFWYHQNRALDARSFGQAALPAKIGNTFGATLGGPVQLPKIYNGKNKTFFYFTWESLRFPRQSVIRNTVPTEFVKNGDFSREGGVLRDPSNGQPFAGNVIPTARISAVARQILPFYPAINFGPTTSRTVGNYIDNRSANIESDQFETRVDHTFSPKHSVFGRFFRKSFPAVSPNNLLLPSDTQQRIFSQYLGSWTWTVKPNLLNELRGGLVKSEQRAQFPFDGLNFFKGLGLRDISTDIFFNGLPNFSIDQYQSFSKGRPGFSVSWNTQFIDNLTWIKGKHTFKFGFDIRRLRAESALGFTTGDSYGDYNFNGTFSGNPFADFLLGAPNATQIAQLTADNDGSNTHWKAYAQDTWRATNRLTIDLGLRWEFSPGYADQGFNIANFDRTVPRTGAVIVMSDPKARTLVAPGAALSFNACPGPTIDGVACTPIRSASEVGLPEGLRQNYYRQFLPRLGIAYRLNDKTTIRSSFGVYNMLILGSVFFSLTARCRATCGASRTSAPTDAPSSCCRIRVRRAAASAAGRWEPSNSGRRIRSTSGRRT